MDVPTLWLSFARWLTKGGGGHRSHSISFKSRATAEVSAPIIEIQLRPLSSSPQYRSAKERLSKTMPTRTKAKPKTVVSRHCPTILLPGGSWTPVMFMVFEGDNASRPLGPSGDPSFRWTKPKAAKRRPAIVDVATIFGSPSGSARNEAVKED